MKQEFSLTSYTTNHTNNNMQAENFSALPLIFPTLIFLVIFFFTVKIFLKNNPPVEFARIEPKDTSTPDTSQALKPEKTIEDLMELIISEATIEDSVLGARTNADNQLLYSSPLPAELSNKDTSLLPILAEEVFVYADKKTDETPASFKVWVSWLERSNNSTVPHNKIFVLKNKWGTMEAQDEVQSKINCMNHEFCITSVFTLS